MLEERILNLKEFNRNPVNHENQEWANKNNSKNHEKYREQQKSRSYIRQEYINWNFSDIVQEYHQTKESAIKFAFKFECSNSGFSLENPIRKTNNYICIFKEDKTKEIIAYVKGYQYPQQLVWFASKQANAHDFFS